MLDEKTMKRGMRLAYAGQSIGILLAMLILRSAFGPLFLKHLGATDSLTMWVFAVPGLLPLIQIPLSLWVPPHRTKTALLVGWGIWGALMIPVALIPDWISDETTALAWVTGVLVTAIFVNMGAATFWFPLLADVIPKERRGRFFGRLRATWTTLLYLTIVLLGLYLGPDPDLPRFQRVILLGVCLVLIRNLIVAFVPTPKQRQSDAADYRDWRRYIKEIVAHRLLRNFFCYYTLFGAAAGLLAHPLVLYMNDLGVNPRDNILIFGSTTLGMVLVLFIGGSVIDRVGTRGVFRTAHYTLIATLLLTLGSTCLPDPLLLFGLAAIFVLSGATVALSNLACTTHLFAFIPAQGRVFYLSFSNLMLTIGPALALFVTGGLLRGTSMGHRLSVLGTPMDIFQIMLIGAFILLLATTPLLKRITE